MIPDHPEAWRDPARRERFDYHAEWPIFVGCLLMMYAVAAGVVLAIDLL